MMRAEELTRIHGDKIPLHGMHLKDIDSLMTEAAIVEPAFRAATKQFVYKAGGDFKPGPLKKYSRVREKTESEYGNNFRRVCDVVRNSGGLRVGLIREFLCYRCCWP